MAGKAHLYHQTAFLAPANAPNPVSPPAAGNWWLNAFAHYGPDKELLLFHRVTGELGLGRGTPLVRPRPQRGGDVACQSAGARPWPEDSPSAL
ncbi:hypothetical protein MNEG_11122 [Monoraphidium neglectum]|uniref:Uncharacterized protein n=1 Tax=Monoraphidium neglectum TaxID=145388 RepID=A0A0D2KM70_9CHLO|nr:hypothetical protein MNEG_11122 [Monoraphidium neglectum]KIY96838.1 hypothetical protein MNEG_11122 [Monoraphidium neglectum]|eukprot:XP_013895858.1 hypothetical protein MNEG_11122 [Monoraphidium neglectum]